MNAAANGLARGIRVVAGQQAWQYVPGRGLLFLARPQMHERVARCSSEDRAASLAERGGAMRAGSTEQAPVANWEDVDERA